MKIPRPEVALLALVVLAAVAARTGRMNPSADGGEPKEPAPAASPSPQWQVGQQWTVETTARQAQDRRSPQAHEPPPKALWCFEVMGTEKLAGVECFRVKVSALVGDRAALVAEFWAEAATRTLRQVDTRLPYQGGTRTVSESYRPAGGKPTPALGQLAAVPIDLPLFPPDGAKPAGPQEYSYEAVSGPAGTKPANALGFAMAIEQELSTPPVDRVKALVAEDFRKSAGTDPVVRVALKAGSRTVTQYWQGGLPWPVYADNGVVEARLVSVKSPEPARK